MSEKSSNRSKIEKIKQVIRRKKPEELAVAVKKREYTWNRLVVFPVWVLVAFFAAQFVVIGVLWLMDFTGNPATDFANQTVVEAVIAAVVYVVAFVITFGVPYLAKKRPVSLELLGIARLPSWGDIGLAPLAFIAYLIITASLLYLATNYIPGFPANQVQEVGFKFIGNEYERLIAFLTLVVIAPIAEEVLFRGYLFGKLLKRVPILPAMIVTSLVFGLVHGQWNVGLDTFALSMVMCTLRVITGSIWAGVLLHMMKNGIAFYLLFVNQITSGMGA
jgi:uncharacterized protein